MEPVKSPIIPGQCSIGGTPLAMPKLEKKVLKRIISFLDMNTIRAAQKSLPGMRDAIHTLKDDELLRLNQGQSLLDKLNQIPEETNPKRQLWRLDENTVYITSRRKLREIAKDPTTPSKVLGYWHDNELKGLAGEQDLQTLINVGANESTETSVLGFIKQGNLYGLAAADNCYIQEAVAGNRNTDPSVLGMNYKGVLRGLAAAICYDTREIVANNSNAFLYVLKILENDTEEKVRKAASETIKQLGLEKKDTNEVEVLDTKTQLPVAFCKGFLPLLLSNEPVKAENQTLSLQTSKPVAHSTKK